MLNLNLAWAFAPSNVYSRSSAAGGSVALTLVVGAVAACSLDASNLDYPLQNMLDGGSEDLGHSEAPGRDIRDVAISSEVSDSKKADGVELARDSPVLDDVATDALTSAGGISGNGGTSGTGGFSGNASGGTNTTGGTNATGGIGGTGGMVSDADLVLWYKFDESSGTTAVDSSTVGGGPHNATLAAMGAGAIPTFAASCQVGSHALSLKPSARPIGQNGGYVTVPSLQTLAPNAVTLAVWVNLATTSAEQNWERIFDFGSGPKAGINFYLSARAGGSAAKTGPVRFSMSPPGVPPTPEQKLQSRSSLNASAWHHVAIVLPAGAVYTGTLYIDGVADATNEKMTLHPADLGATTNNWLGRSQTAEDPLFDGLLDDFRVYRRALAPEEIAVLYTLH